MTPDNLLENDFSLWVSDIKKKCRTKWSDLSAEDRTLLMRRNKENWAQPEFFGGVVIAAEIPMGKVWDWNKFPFDGMLQTGDVDLLSRNLDQPDKYDERRCAIRGRRAFIWVDGMTPQDLAVVERALEALGVADIVYIEVGAPPLRYFKDHPDRVEALDGFVCLAKEALRSRKT